MSTQRRRLLGKQEHDHCPERKRPDACWPLVCCLVVVPIIVFLAIFIPLTATKSSPGPTPLPTPAPTSAPTAGTPARYIFVTENTYDGEPDSESGADDICEDEADASSLDHIANRTRKFKALLRTVASGDIDTIDISSVERLQFDDVPILLPSGIVVATDWDTFISEALHPAPILLHPISENPSGVNVTGEHRVWTGDRNSEAEDWTCEQWMSNSAFDRGVYGVIDQVSYQWRVKQRNSTEPDAFLACNTALRFYCIMERTV